VRPFDTAEQTKEKVAVDAAHGEFAVWRAHPVFIPTMTTFIKR